MVYAKSRRSSINMESGKRKYVSSESGLILDSVFVSGLIFELKHELRKEIAGKKIEAVEAPAQIIELLMG